MNSAIGYSEGAEVPEDKTTDNELIAEFMGAELIRKPDTFYPDKFNETYIFKGHPGNWRVEKEIKTHLSAPMLCYHTDWDWIMPVVHKIKKDKHDPNHMFMGTTLGRQMAYSTVTESPIYTPIDTLHKRCVEFIKWYNHQKLKNKPI